MQDLQYLIAHKKPHRLIDGVIPIIYSSGYMASNTNCYKRLKINKLQSKTVRWRCEKIMKKAAQALSLYVSV